MARGRIKKAQVKVGGGGTGTAASSPTTHIRWLLVSILLVLIVRQVMDITSVQQNYFPSSNNDNAVVDTPTVRVGTTATNTHTAAAAAPVAAVWDPKVNPLGIPPGKAHNVKNEFRRESLGTLEHQVPQQQRPVKFEEEAVDDDDGKLHVVISHCKLSIGWIWKSYLSNQSYESVTILSKCGVPIRPEDMPPITRTHHQQDQDQEQNDKILVQIISLPNVGRCDHSYAYWIAMVLGNEEKSMKDDYQLLYSNRDQNKSNNNINNNNSSSNNSINPFQSITIDPKDYIIFMKDNKNKYSYFKEISLPNMFVEMKTNNVGMACASVLNNFPGYRDSMTSWAHRGVMWNQVQMGEYRANKYEKNQIIVDFQASHKPMGEWIRYLSVYNENENKKYNHNSSNKSSYYNSSDDDDHHHHHQVFSDKYLENISRSMQKIPNKDSKSYDELDLVPVCFGGRFMTRWGQLSFDDAPIKNWSTITKGLGRGDNIEEGHYMERWWADILSWSSYSSRLITIIDATETSDDNAKTATTNTTNTNAISGIIFKNRDHTIFYDESRPHRRSAGEVLTQNEQRNVLSKKSSFVYKNRGFSGMILLRKNNNNTGIDKQP